MSLRSSSLISLWDNSHCSSRTIEIRAPHEIIRKLLYRLVEAAECLVRSFIWSFIQPFFIPTSFSHLDRKLYEASWKTIDFIIKQLWIYERGTTIQSRIMNHKWRYFLLCWLIFIFHWHATKHVERKFKI